MIFEEAIKHQAGTVRNIGFVFCTPTCIQTLNSLLTGFEISNTLSIGVLISLGLFAFGFHLIASSYKIMKERDKKYAKQYGLTLN